MTVGRVGVLLVGRRMILGAIILGRFMRSPVGGFITAPIGARRKAVLEKQFLGLSALRLGLVLMLMSSDFISTVLYQPDF